jgi:GT2 family glycosyltransferase
MHSELPRVAVLTVTYGARWEFLSRVLEAVMKDPHVMKMVIVDNGSKNKESIQAGAHPYGDKVIILRQEKNLGSAGGFAKGIEYVRNLDCEYVLMLDDDNLPEDGAIGRFLEQKKMFQNEKVILVGNRVNIPGNTDIFFGNEKGNVVPKGTFFEALSWKKIQHFLSLLTGRELHKKRAHVTPRSHIANESFVYGGAFLPIQAIRQAPIPDEKLVLYGDDIEYSWGIKRLGYESYICYSPKIYDIDMSFGEGSQAVGVMSPETRDFRAYYRIRNMILISRRNTTQSKFMLFLNSILWLAGLFALGAVRYGISRGYVKKVVLASRAFLAGYFPHMQVPDNARLPH